MHIAPIFIPRPIIIVIFFLTSTVQAQISYEGIRYHIEHTAMLSFLTEHPEKESSIRKNMNQLPAFMDFQIINHQLVEVLWKKDSTFLGMNIYDSLKKEIIHIDHQGEINTTKLIDSISFSFSAPKDTLIEGTELSIVELKTEKPYLIPPALFIYKPDSLQAPKNIALENLVPEVRFINLFSVFPLKTLVGIPEQMMTFITKKAIPHPDQSLKDFMKGKRTKKNRLELVANLRMN